MPLSDETPSPPEKVRKAPPKKGKKGGEAAAPVPVTVEALRAVPLFRAIDDALLARLCERVVLVERVRGERLHEGPPVADDVSPVFVILEGDVAVERAVGPDAQAPLETVNYLRPGEAWVQKLFADEHTRSLRLTAMVPMRALQLTYGDLNALLKRNAHFRDDFSAAIRAVTERQVTHFDNEFQKDIAKFFVEQRLTFAGRVKVKRMDICIECDGCYDACRSRHGHGSPRFERGEVRPHGDSGQLPQLRRSRVSRQVQVRPPEPPPGDARDHHRSQLRRVYRMCEGVQLRQHPHARDRRARSRAVLSEPVARREGQKHRPEVRQLLRLRRSGLRDGLPDRSSLPGRWQSPFRLLAAVRGPCRAGAGDDRLAGTPSDWPAPLLRGVHPPQRGVADVGVFRPAPLSRADVRHAFPRVGRDRAASRPGRAVPGR
jgi:CRP-like cAMP-binding protein